ncbi:MAG: type II toxin-antitoxin system VapC family toxin [Desulfomicrobium sp.]|nr:type II toxin-antitoxin system VapC family toxin [Pseudomonadota bacterium]MBV1713889.1 type II toxin-antitoxin system VapC family toxin [Desulfomicrobium sp.]MBU4572424.1 type II toxin-antitoxin system VapC family toxin [Pseudomonadota bacterium]MBU4594404.1 type II toxin-antitoxin system VapC family toxin [Pseudomonadota bacterium]MBV1719571.1 type II toxin-antitoxin system VapC family toxin [Desulfomicrobium sp.]
MKLLLDTHMLLWAAAGTLPKKAESLVGDANNTLYFSSASIWEIGIKKGLGRNDFRVDPEVLRRGLLDNQYNELCITSLHALAVNDLPMLHKDPFDRMLLAQAKSEGISLLTSDSIMHEYPAPVLFVPKMPAV